MSAPPPTPPAVAQHLYVGSNLALNVFTLPLTSASTPIATLATPTTGLKTDTSNHLFVSNFTTAVKAYTLPLTSASTPAFSLTFGFNVIDLTTSTSGTLFAAEPVNATCCIEAATAPITAASGVAYSLVSNNPFGVTVDPMGNLFGAGSGVVQKYAAPAGAGTAPVSYSHINNNLGIASDAGGNIYVANGAAGDGTIDVYAPGAMAAAFSISVSPGTSVGYIAFDATGHMYVTTFATPGSIRVYNPPLTAASTAAFSVALTNAFNLAVGP